MNTKDKNRIRKKIVTSISNRQDEIMKEFKLGAELISSSSCLYNDISSSSAIPANKHPEEFFISNSDIFLFIVIYFVIDYLII